MLNKAALCFALLLAGCSGTSAHHSSPPGPSPTSSPTATATPPASVKPVSLRGTDWRRVPYPFSCAPVGYKVQQVTYVTLDQPSALVLVRCDAGAGAPPSALLMYTASASGRAELAQTLVPISHVREHNEEATAFTLTGTTVSMKTYTYSSPTLPDCCPDIQRRLVWHWNGSTYVRVA